MTKLFFSYSHKDEDLRNELETHLAMLKRQRTISAWHDRRIAAGSDFGQAIDHELESSQIILLLVSANFLASDYCFQKEMSRALERHTEGTAVVVPVILHPCDWQSAPFGHLRATPTDGKPVSMHANQHEAFAIIAKDIREIAMRFSGVAFNAEPTIGSTPASGATGTGQVSRPRSSNLRVKRKFDDHERDEFLENSYEYIARYFEASLGELSARHAQLKTRFKRTDATSFTASIYDGGERVAQCAIWYGRTFGSPAIAYSSSGEATRNSYNESLSVADDGFSLHLNPLGMQFHGGPSDDRLLTQQGAAEFLWGILIRPLQ